MSTVAKGLPANAVNCDMHVQPIPNTVIYPYHHILLIVVAVAVVFSIYPLAGFMMLRDTYGVATELQAPQFELLDADGKTKSIEDYRGRYVYLMFGFMRCEKVCHTQVTQLVALANLLDDTELQFLYLAMDSKHDDPSLLREYFDKRGDNFTSLHASNLAQMQSVASGFNAGYRFDGNPSNANYNIEHPARIFLIDPSGQLQFVYYGAVLDTVKIAEEFYRLNSTSTSTSTS